MDVAKYLKKEPSVVTAEDIKRTYELVPFQDKRGIENVILAF